MNWYTLFYLFSILDKLTNTFVWMAAISTLSIIVLTIVYLYNQDRIGSGGYNADEGKHWLNVIKWPLRLSYIIGIIFWILVILVPTRKDMILIIAGGAVGEFITTDSSSQKLPADITRFLRGEILKATAELSDEAKASIGLQTEADKIKKLSREELEKLVLEKIDKKEETTN